MRHFDFSGKLVRHFVKPGKVGALESQELVILVTILERQGFELALGEIRTGFKVQLNHFVSCGNALLFQVLLEGGHIPGIYAENVQRLKPFQMEPFRPLCRCTALEGVLPALQPHTAPEQLDDLRTFSLAHVEQPHGRNSPTAPPFREFA